MEGLVWETSDPLVSRLCLKKEPSSLQKEDLTCTKVISAKNSLAILDCFLFQVANGEMTITASDSDNVIKSVIPLTDSEGEGEFCVPNRVILDALKELPEQPLSFDVDTDTFAIKIVYQNGLYNFTGQYCRCASVFCVS